MGFFPCPFWGSPTTMETLMCSPSSVVVLGSHQTRQEEHQLFKEWMAIGSTRPGGGTRNAHQWATQWVLRGPQHASHGQDDQEEWMWQGRTEEVVGRRSRRQFPWGKMWKTDETWRSNLSMCFMRSIGWDFVQHLPWPFWPDQLRTRAQA